MGSCAAPSAKGDDKFITTDYLQQCRILKEVNFEIVKKSRLMEGLWVSSDRLECVQQL